MDMVYCRIREAFTCEIVLSDQSIFLSDETFLFNFRFPTQVCKSRDGFDFVKTLEHTQFEKGHHDNHKRILEAFNLKGKPELRHKKPTRK